ncbi:acylphosphatase [Marinithermus hydrothermalis]|uniref:acylphosphatase n=1 Tax=Marinithermus hydrothermalis (strain DSM 14884 / JCM 11576 / T1) TaxID=869210 RepID=F2NLI9_MARHT|nr:acylphosphatase [Marinithermus hydrothermalis]AEB12088.1 Acylphosphatase [Marinithermus hydrothermalis DSM 14884]
MQRRVVVLIRGRVQGVGFRAFAQKKALELGLSGYAENLSDGRVEVVAEGEEALLEQFLAFLQQGPRLSRVEGVEVQWSEPSGLRGFYVY